MAFALDGRIREATGNAAGLDDLMQALYREFGTTDHRYSFDDIVRVASEVSGQDQSDFFARFVAGTDFLDTAACFEVVGLQLTTFADECYVSVRSDASDAARSRRLAILGR